MVGRRSTKDVATDEASEDATTEGQRTLYGFRAVYVFDVTQTEGKELPALTEVNGDVSGYRERPRSRSVEARAVELKFQRNCSREGPFAWREDHAAFRDAASRGVLHALVHSDRPRNVAIAGDRRTLTTKQVRETEAEARGPSSSANRSGPERNFIPGLHPALAWRRQSSARELGSRSTNRCRDPQGALPRAMGFRGSRIRRLTPAPFGFQAGRVRLCPPTNEPTDNERRKKIMPSTQAKCELTTMNIAVFPSPPLWSQPTILANASIAKSLEELAASFKTQVILAPLLVRELAASPVRGQQPGHAVSRAAKLAELERLPVRVVKLTDAEAIEAQCVENLQREDIHPLEEALGFKSLLELGEPAYSIATIASRAGKSEAYVYGRIRLADLIPPVAEAFLKDQITIGHALLIAKLPASQQQEAFSAAFRGLWTSEGNSQVLIPVRELAAWIESNILPQLASAPFDKQDETLVPEAGSCANCPESEPDSTNCFSPDIA